MLRKPKFGTYPVNRAAVSKLMGKLDWSQKELHDESGVDPKTIRRALTGDGVSITRNVLMSLAGAFNKNMEHKEHIAWTDLIAGGDDVIGESFLARFRRYFGGLHGLIDPPGLPGNEQYQFDTLYVPLRL